MKRFRGIHSLLLTLLIALSPAVTFAEPMLGQP